jgi:prevent-host-death family protein
MPESEEARKTSTVTASEARDSFADLVNRVEYGGERIVVTRHGRPIAALISAADLASLEAQAEKVA